MIWHRLMRVFALITSFGAFLMLLLGALVTKTNSGQGCGQTWPFCHGQLLPASMTINGLYEYSHRIASGADGFLILILALWSWLAYRKDTKVKLLAFLSLFFVVLQGALGAVTVVFEGSFAKYPLLALHFGFSLISFASVALLTTYLFQIANQLQQHIPQKVQPVTKQLQYAIWGLLAYTYIVVYSGALVQHTEAALGCGKQFPGCSTYLPDLTSSAGVQMLHRYAAASIWLLILAFLVLILRQFGARRDLVNASWWALALVTLQALAGVMTVLSGVTLIWGMVHTIIISFLFVVLSYLGMQIGWPWQKKARIVTPENNPQYPSTGVLAKH